MHIPRSTVSRFLGFACFGLTLALSVACGDEEPSSEPTDNPGANSDAGASSGGSNGGTSGGSSGQTSSGDGGSSGVAPVTDCPPGFERGATGCVSTGGTTYYVRSDGGTLAQCDGTTDAALAGASGKACAWSHPFYALPPVGSSLVTPFAGGDLLIVAAGNYAIGAGAVSDTGHSECDVVGAAAYDCSASAVPSGTAAMPTRIVGVGFDHGCAAAPQWWGTWRTHTIINLQGSSHVAIACLDITDHVECSRGHNSASYRCAQDIGMVEGYAYNGIVATDSEDVSLRDLNVHGLDRGILAGRIGNWTLDRVHLRGNVAAGWDGDVEGDDHNTGPVTMRDGSISWSGCIERYPDSAAEPVGCVSQDRGGYGDGLGTGATGGNWTFDNFDFHHNVSDGLDLLYLDDLTARVTVRNSHFEANAGNAIKIAGGGHTVENVTVVGNCGFFDQGTKWPDMVNHCRALGNSFSLGSAGAEPITLSNVSGWTEGDCLILHSGPVVIRDSLTLGSTDYLQPDETSCFAYTETGGATVTASNLVAYGFKASASGCDLGIDASGAVGHCTDPGFTAGSIHSSHADPNYAFDLSLAPSSAFFGHVPPLGAQPF